MQRFARARPALLVTAAVFAVLAQAAGLAMLPALIGFALISTMVLLREWKSSVDREAPDGNSPDGIAADPVVEALIEALPEPAIVLTPDSLIVAFNTGAQQVSPEVSRGEPISFALRAPDVLEAVRVATGRRELQRAEFLQRVPADRWWQATIAPLALPGPAAQRESNLVLVTFRDLTPLRRAEEMRSDFVANASHELRTPLASLSGFIETLQGPARNDAAARDRFLAIMKEQATRMARLIQDLLSLSRIEQKAHIHPDLPVEIETIVREVADGLGPLAQERGVKITIADGTSPLTVLGDRDELIGVFQNLIENALKYGAPGKRVDISLAREPTNEPADAVISVRDYGPGIAPEHLPRLTERFYRVDIGESRAQGGTGLGLALVKHILTRHRGRLAIESTPGQGANFIVRLPLAARKSK